MARKLDNWGANDGMAARKWFPFPDLLSLIISCDRLGPRLLHFTALNIHLQRSGKFLENCESRSLRDLSLQICIVHVPKF